MIIRMNLLFFILLILSSCQSMEYNEISKQETIENNIIAQTAKQLEKEKKLIPIGFGGSNIKGKEFLSISFQYFQPLKIEEARRLIIYSAQTFLDNLSKSIELNKILKEPYRMKNIEIVIFCYMADYSKVSPPNIGLVDFSRGTIMYIDNNQHYEILYKETYEEALEKIKNEN